MQINVGGRQRILHLVDGVIHFATAFYSFEEEEIRRDVQYALDANTSSPSPNEHEHNFLTTWLKSFDIETGKIQPEPVVESATPAGTEVTKTLKNIEKSNAA